jgi:hypothetical protein
MYRYLWLFCLLSLPFSLSLGCGSGSAPQKQVYEPKRVASGGPIGAEWDNGGTSHQAPAGPVYSSRTEPAAEKPSIAGAPKAEAARATISGQPPADRKIIFTADIHIKVENFAKAEEALLQLVENNHGYTAKADVSATTGGTRRGTWTIRLPVANFAPFQEAAKKIGELTRFTADAKEVTEEYFDLQSRVKNKEAELETLRKIFDKGWAKIEEVLTVQREVNRAQGELEQMKGRQRVLDNLTELTTVTVHLQERELYVPPTPLPPPPVVSFGSTVSDTFFGSINVLIRIGKALVIAGAAVAPWVPLVAVVGCVAWVVVRRRVGARGITR